MRETSAGPARRAIRWLRPAIAMAAMALGLSGQAWAATYTVNTVNDSNGSCDAADCSLREALAAANADATKDTVQFNISGNGVHTITPTSDLPEIVSPIVIDGYTQPGSGVNTSATASNAVLRIELNGGSSSATMLRISGGNSEVRGLVINRARAGIDIFTRGGNLIGGCFIGTNAAGTSASRNTFDGIYLPTANNVVGGTTPASRNVISGNNLGVEIIGAAATGNIVQGNLIGTNAAGNAANAGNERGVQIAEAAGNTIGGTSAGARNLISGNNVGVALEGAQANSNTVLGNYIGTNAAARMQQAAPRWATASMAWSSSARPTTPSAAPRPARAT